jgi:hypothetical protein
MADSVSIPRLDHVAIRVGDRAAFAAGLVEQLDVHVIEHTDRLTLVGAHADHGKITVLDAIDERDPTPNRIVSLVLAEGAGAAVPPPVVMPGGLVLTFASIDDLGPGWQDTPRHALVGVSLRAADPTAAARELQARYDMRVATAGPEHAVVEVGRTLADGRLTLSRESWAHDDRPSMLDHVGIRVVDALGTRERFETDGIDIARWVEVDHSRAVFVDGPEQLQLEYLELTAPLDDT